MNLQSIYLFLEFLNRRQYFCYRGWTYPEPLTSGPRATSAATRAGTESNVDWVDQDVTIADERRRSPESAVQGSRNNVTGCVRTRGTRLTRWYRRPLEVVTGASPASSTATTNSGELRKRNYRLLDDIVKSSEYA
jgi:hypothetical protein